MPLLVLIFLAAKFVVYSGFFFLAARLLDVGVPLDALRAGLHRTWLGAAATIVTLVIYIFCRFAEVAPETNHRIGTVLIWVFRAAVWTYVTTQVYRVTRWRKGKLAVVVLAGLALNLAIDVGLDRLQGPGDNRFMPSMGQWQFRLC